MPTRSYGILIAWAVLTLTGGCTPVTPASSTPWPKEKRMQWFRGARYGLFVHFGPFSQWYRHRNDWGTFCTPLADESREQFDRRFTEGITPKPGAVRAWVKLARDAGMKYVVFTAKHHEGFCLWDSKLTDYNSVNLGPKFDMVREFVDACHEFDMGVGIYYSLADGHHVDAKNSPNDEAARRRFVDFTHGLVRELMTNYGKIDILWYDGPFPLGYPEQWESLKMNRMVRSLQPHIAINDRAMADGDFTCSENAIHDWIPSIRSDWEACITFNNAWPYVPKPPEEYLTEKDILRFIQRCTSMKGNFLLNVGPNAADGAVTDIEQQRLRTVGKWLSIYGDAVYGHVDRAHELGMTDTVKGGWSRKGDTAWFWIFEWPQTRQVVIENVTCKVKSVALLPDNTPLPFTQTAGRLTIAQLPATCPDKIVGVGMLKLTFENLRPVPTTQPKDK